MLILAFALVILMELASFVLYWVWQGEPFSYSGVRFFDMTALFSRMEEPLYVDSKRHFNERGCELVAQAMAEKIMHVLGRGASPDHKLEEDGE